MYPEIFYSNTFTLLAEAEVGKHFYWDLAGFLVHGQVLVVIWFVLLVLLIFAFLGTSNAERIPHGFQNLVKFSGCPRSKLAHGHPQGRRGPRPTARSPSSTGCNRRPAGEKCSGGLGGDLI